VENPERSERRPQGGGRVPPSNTQAEESLLGAMLLSPEAVEVGVKTLTPNDFYKPANGIVFEALLASYYEGERPDPVTIGNRLVAMDQLDAIGGPAYLIHLQAGTPATTNAKRYAKIIAEHAMLRQLINAASEIAEIGYNLPEDVDGAMETAMGILADVVSAGVKIGSAPDDLYILDEFLQRPESERPDWCIEGLLRIGWRAMIVAQEGAGKTTLFRQIAIAAAQGIHPLDFSSIDPCRSLIVDLENPDDAVMDTCNPILERTLGTLGERPYDPERAWLWHRPSGINIRNRADRVTFEAVLAHVRPNLVCIGPLYKMYEVGPRDNDEQAAREVMAVLDDLRGRYKFGLLMEHHAPKETAGTKRKMMPYGSSLWLRWPEIGLSLNPESTTEGDFSTMKVGRWRGDRNENAWPTKLHRGGDWPWEGEYEVGGNFSGMNSTPRESSHGGYSPPPAYDDYDDDGFPDGEPF
jgi:hypothetical protein